MRPSFSSQKPLFLSIAEWLEGAILAGIFSEESQVPSITEISVEYNINPATALKGVNILVESGLLYKKRGLGMFVATGARVRLMEIRQQRFFEDFIRPLVLEARRLEISETAINDMIERGFNE